MPGLARDLRSAAILVLALAVGPAYGHVSFIYYGTIRVDGPVTAEGEHYHIQVIDTADTSTRTCHLAGVVNGIETVSTVLVRGTFDPTLQNNQVLDPRGDVDDGGADALIGLGPQSTRITFGIPANTSVSVVTLGTPIGDEAITFQTAIFCADNNPIEHGSCAAPGREATTACLIDDRFRVTAEFLGYPGPSRLGGLANVVNFGSSDSALFWFVDPSNWELQVKIVDFCELNNRYGVFVGGTTDLQVDILVEDTKNQFPPLRFHNPLGQDFDKISAAFAGTCDGSPPPVVDPPVSPPPCRSGGDACVSSGDCCSGLSCQVDSYSGVRACF